MNENNLMELAKSYTALLGTLAEHLPDTVKYDNNYRTWEIILRLVQVESANMRRLLERIELEKLASATKSARQVAAPQVAIPPTVPVEEEETSQQQPAEGNGRRRKSKSG